MLYNIVKMPKTKGGAKIRKALKEPEEKRLLRLKKRDFELVNKETGQKKIIKSDEIYGQVESRLGGSIVLLKDEFNQKRKCRICGKLYRGRRNKVWIKPEQIVLVNYELTQKPDKDGFLFGEIVHVYNTSEIHKLNSTGELDTDVFDITSVEKEDCGFEWDYSEEPTPEELKAQKKEENLKSDVYVNYDELVSSSDDDIDINDI